MADPETKVRYISLGSSCYVTDILKEKGLKRETFPFDWCVSTLSFVIRHVLSGFTLPIEFTQLVQGDDHGYAYGPGWLAVHDFDNLSKKSIGDMSSELLNKEWEKAIPSVKEKYQRRFLRLKSYCEAPKGKVVFIRYKIDYPKFEDTQDSIAQCLLLVKALEETFPKLDFQLMYIGPIEAGDLILHPRISYHLCNGVHGLVHCRAAVEKELEKQ